jgi:tetratricopeptide (TPR) repeat protein
VSYHRPGVKGRPIWGALVPYGEVWRAGANENTTISFSLPLRIGGKPLEAGTYGLHMIPGKGDWTVIVSRNATSWGSFFYSEAEDALRIAVTPEAALPMEWLQYEFSDLTDSSAVLSLRWEKMRVPIPLSFDTRGLILADIRTSYLRGAAGFGWQGFNNAAVFCLRNNVDLPEALTWAEKSIALNENFSNLRTKASILEKMGKQEDARALRERSLEIATETDLNQLGYTFLQGGKTKEAIEVFEKNVKAHPSSWNVYDSLAEGLEKSGDTKGAIAGYEKALARVKDAANRKRITETITKLKSH